MFRFILIGLALINFFLSMLIEVRFLFVCHLYVCLFVSVCLYVCSLYVCVCSEKVCSVCLSVFLYVLSIFHSVYLFVYLYQLICFIIQLNEFELNEQLDVFYLLTSHRLDRDDLQLGHIIPSISLDIVDKSAVKNPSS